MIDRNKLNEAENGPPSSQEIITLPFILVNAPKESRINCEMLEDRTQYQFDFDMPFTVNEDIEVLRMMNLATKTDSPHSLDNMIDKKKDSIIGQGLISRLSPK